MGTSEANQPSRNQAFTWMALPDILFLRCKGRVFFYDLRDVYRRENERIEFRSLSFRMQHTTGSSYGNHCQMARKFFRYDDGGTIPNERFPRLGIDREMVG